MGNKTLVYKQKVYDNLSESYKHLLRLENAVVALERNYIFPLSIENFKDILESIEHLAYSDQIIYRFSKLQDCMGAKLFKSLLLYEGENINRPFLDILNQLETIDLRNEIAHDYEDNDEIALNILNTIYKLRMDLQAILDAIQKIVG